MPLQKKLDRLYKKYNRREYVSPDPLQFLYSYPDKREREIAGLIAAAFAYGNVKQIIKTVSGVLSVLGPSPRDFILKEKYKDRFKGFKYRFTAEGELLNLLGAVNKIIKKHGSLEACFMARYSAEDKTIERPLKAFAAELRSYGNVKSLIPDPAKNSSLKRLNLYLRWMARRDGVDPGGWKVAASRLLVPLDTHMHRIARQLGLTKRNSADIKTAAEISAALARYCKEDPVKYDFCLTRFGIRDDMDQSELEK